MRRSVNSLWPRDAVWRSRSGSRICLVAWRHQAMIWARFLSLTRSKMRLCSAIHRPCYWSNLSCDWPSTAGAYCIQARDKKRTLIQIWAIDNDPAWNTCQCMFSGIPPILYTITQIANTSGSMSIKRRINIYSTSIRGSYQRCHMGMGGGGGGGGGVYWVY